jgi:FtsH-binding integral membrane protein
MAYNDVSVQSQTSLLSKVFGWFAVALGLSSATAVGVYFLLSTGILAPGVYFPLLMASSIVYFVVYLWVVIAYSRRSSNTIAIPFVIYAISLGVVLSTVMLVYDVSIIGYALGLTAAIFGAMAIYGATTKAHLGAMGNIASMVILGSFVLALFNLFIGSSSLYWIISFAMFGAIVLLVSYQVWMVKRIDEMGQNDTNTAIFLALSLYASFVSIFLRILQFLAYSRRR